MTKPEIIKETSLTFQKGNSDKVYYANIMKVDDNQYSVNFAYGRWGYKPTVGSKTDECVSLDKATTIYEKLVASKVKKGYQVDS